MDCIYCYDGTFIGAVFMIGNDNEYHKILYCPNCGRELEYWKREV